MTEKFNYLSLARITKLSLALYQKLISMGMHLILQSLVLISKIAQFQSYAVGLYSELFITNVTPCFLRAVPSSHSDCYVLLWIARS